MKYDQLLNPLRQNIRQFNPVGIEFHLNRLLKKAQESATESRLKSEIYLEAVKSFRVLDRSREASDYCDLAMSAIPASSLDLLAALKRLRALIYLDEGDTISARNIIEEADGLEMTLDGGTSVVNRKDSDVTVETWLVSVEVALTEGNAKLAQEFLDKAVNRISEDERKLRQQRISPKERRVYENYYEDLGQMLTLYCLTLGLVTGVSGSRAQLSEFCEQIEEDNKKAVAENKTPNLALYSKLLCLLGNETSHPGLCSAEAARWKSFASGIKSEGLQLPVLRKSEKNGQETAIISAETSLSGVSLPPSASELPLQALSVTTAAMERITGVFLELGKILPNIDLLIKNGGNVKPDFTQRGFSGHLLDTDICNILQNIRNLQFTGFIKLGWDKNLYKDLVMKGTLPENALSGEAVLYAFEGTIIDTVFANQSFTNTLETAQNNFVLIVRMCLSIGIEDTRPDILATAVPEESVALRPRILNIIDNDLLFITSDIEAQLQGITFDEVEDPQDSETTSEFVEDLFPAEKFSDELETKNRHISQDNAGSEDILDIL